MGYFRRHIISRVVCLLMAFHLFNVSVDMPDAQPDYVPEDLSINDMESVVEIVLEECLDIDNAIEEHDEAGDESDDLQITKTFKLCCTHLPELKLIVPHISPAPVPVFKEGHCNPYIREINPPPPKA